MYYLLEFSLIVLLSVDKNPSKSVIRHVRFEIIKLKLSRNILLRTKCDQQLSGGGGTLTINYEATCQTVRIAKFRLFVVQKLYRRKYKAK